MVNESTAPSLVHRPVKFSFTADTSVVWTPSMPEFSWAANSLSLMMPYVEPFFVSTMREVVPQLDRPLAATVDIYIRQEAAHLGQHRSFNRFLVLRCPRLSWVERCLAGMFGWLEYRSLHFRVAFTAASEMIAYAIARWTAGRYQTIFVGAHPEVAEMFLWHLAEEVEHKAVAHDVHKSLGVGRRTSAFATLMALAVWAWFVLAGVVLTASSSWRALSPIAWGRLIFWGVTLGFEVAAAAVLSTVGRYNPKHLTDPLRYEVWLREFDFQQRSARPRT